MKPPKSWLVEYAKSHKNNSNGEGGENGRSGGSSSSRRGGQSFGGNMDNSFRHYMAKKINMQRGQFGLVLPPPPPPDPNSNCAKISDADRCDDDNEDGRVKVLLSRKESINRIYDVSSERAEKFKRGAAPTGSVASEFRQMKEKRKSLKEKTQSKRVRFQSECIIPSNNNSIESTSGSTTLAMNGSIIGEGANSMAGLLSRLKKKSSRSGKAQKLERAKQRRKRKREEKELVLGRNDNSKSKPWSDSDQTDEIIAASSSSSSIDIDENSGPADMKSTANFSDMANQTEKDLKIAMKSSQSPMIHDVSQTSHTQDGSDHRAHNSTSEKESQSLLQSDNSSQSQSQSRGNAEVEMRQLKRNRKDLFFLGITVQVNGYTDPCSDTIMRTLHKHGGNLEKYETAHVTHIIAEALSTAKAKIYKRQKKPIPVVKPSWIFDCVEAQKLLPHADYLLDEVKEQKISASVKSFFQKKNDASSIRSEWGRNGESINIYAEEEQEHDSSHEKNDVVRDKLPNQQQNVNMARFDSLNEKNFYNKETAIAVIHNQSIDNDNSRDNDDVAQSDASSNLLQSHATFTNASTSVAKASPSSPDSKPNNKIQTEPQKLSSPSKKLSFSGGPRNVGTDPNFLESYFASSRLSFIGSFKQRLGKYNVNEPRAARNANAERFVFHIDMDCFFAAIALRNFPQFLGKPVAVGHSWCGYPAIVEGNIRASSFSDADNGRKSKSNAELSTCNYEARKYGVKKGMFLARARELCPELVVLPYDYDGYEDAAKKTAGILETYAVKYSGAVEQRSCDESYLELHLVKTDVGNRILEPNDFAHHLGENIRREIFSAIQCTVSIGIGENKLLSKLGTNHVKDSGGNGVHLVVDKEALLNDLELKDLEGIGYRLNEKLLSHHLRYVRDVLNLENPKQELCGIIGAGNGSKIYNYCCGIDTRPVEIAERKTIGAECNYGVRFDGPYGVDYMMEGLAKEVERRMTTVGVLARCITVKVKERRQGAGPPGKFNGHGKCNDHSKSAYLPGVCAIRDADAISREGMKLFNEIAIHKDQVRGMGIVMSKLENEDANDDRSGLSTWLRSGIKASNLKITDSTTTAETETVQNQRVEETNREHSSNKGRDALSSRKDDSAVIPKEVMAEQTHNDYENYAIVLDSPERIVEGRQHDDCSQAGKHLSRQEIDCRIGKNLPSIGINTQKKKKGSNSSKFLRQKSSVAKSGGRYRQYDVKCMLKLASIKSGEDKLSYEGGQVSLTQLDSLPLDIQLQVANEGNSTLQYQSRYQSIARNEKASHDNSMNERTEIIEIDSNSVSSEASEEVQADKDDIEHDVEQNEEKCDTIVIREWMDKNKDPSIEDIELMEDFLCTCVSESRLDDVVSILRLIKMRSDVWGSIHYLPLLEKAEQLIKTYEGRCLDKEWLGL